MYLEDCLSRSLGRVICSGSRSSFWISAGTWEFTSILPVQSGSQQGLSCWGFSSSGYRSFASCGGSVTPPAATHSQFSPQTCSVGASVDGVIGSLTSMTYQVPLGVSGLDRTDLPQFNPQETMYSDKSLPGWGAHLDFNYGIRQLASMVSRLGDLLVGVGGNPSGIASFHSSMEEPICSVDVPQSFGGCVHPQTKALDRRVYTSLQRYSSATSANQHPTSVPIRSGQPDSSRGQIIAIERSLHPQGTAAL